MSQLPPYPRFYPAKVDRIFVFNPRFGPREDEDHLKILYYYPATTPLNAQLADIGLAEALSNVTKFVPIFVILFCFFVCELSVC